MNSANNYVGELEADPTPVGPSSETPAAANISIAAVTDPEAENPVKPHPDSCCFKLLDLGITCYTVLGN